MVPGNEAAVKQRKGELDIFRVVTIALLEGADHRAGPQTKIPHSLITTPDVLAKFILQPFVGTKVEQVDVGAREKFLAAKTADGHQSQPRGNGPAALESP